MRKTKSNMMENNVLRQVPKGLVLEGGGLRGMFTNGVLDVFMSHGIGFDARSEEHTSELQSQR